MKELDNLLCPCRCASSATFLRSDPDFDFDAAIAPIPGAIQGVLASWVEDHVDDLIAELAPADDVVAPAAEEGGAAEDDDGSEDDDETMMAAEAMTRRTSLNLCFPAFLSEL